MMKYDPENQKHLEAKERSDLGSRLRAQGRALSAKEGRGADVCCLALARLVEAGRYQTAGDTILIPVSRAGDLSLVALKMWRKS